MEVGTNLALYLVLWLTRCLCTTAIFEVGVSLKWVSGQSDIKSDTCIAKSKSKKEKSTVSACITRSKSKIK